MTLLLNYQLKKNLQLLKLTTYGRGAAKPILTYKGTGESIWEFTD